MVAALFRMFNMALAASCFLSKCYSENNIFVISDPKHLYNGKLKKYEVKMYGCQSMVAKIESVIIKRPQDAFIGPQNLANFWQSFNYTACPDYEKTLLEFAHFEQVLKQHVPKIYYLPRHEKAGLDSIYTHDPVKITRRGAILMNMAKPLRAAEPQVLQAWLAKIGIPVLGKIETPGRMEGGDVIWLNARTLAVGRGYRTNAEGIRQLKVLTTGMVDRIIEVPLPHADGTEACLHLMSLISLIDRDLAVVYSRYLPVFFRQILIAMGIELMISLKGTGGPTCLTCPVLRK